MTNEELKKLAKSLMFEMEDSELETLSKEFEIILKQMALVENYEGISEVEPKVFPNIPEAAEFRDDEVGESLTVDEILSNAKSTLKNQVKVPKVVE